MLAQIERTQIVNQQQILLPVSHVFQEVDPRPVAAKPLTVYPSYVQSIQELFPEQERQEKDIQLAKKSLGVLSVELSADELKNVINEVQFLTETWLDEFERNIFNGLTLQELLHEKGVK